MWGKILVAFLAASPILVLLSLFGIQLLLLLIGQTIKAATQDRREAIYNKYRKELQSSGQKLSIRAEGKDGGPPDVKQSDWNVLYTANLVLTTTSNAGGGGERVLWAAIAATQQKYPQAICAVYTGDHEIERSSMIKKIKQRFEITLYEPTLHFIYLTQRQAVLASSWPRFTLLGQSFGSVVLALDALSILTPDIFVDTMGYAFAVALCRFMLPSVPTGAYVHYPTISTDMLESLDDTTGTKGIHAGRGSGWKGHAKKIYWRMFAWAYGWVGRRIDVVMCNSTWTYGHISKLWKRKASLSPVTILYPPCPVHEVERAIKVSAEAESLRENIFLYIAQFRPEKNHFLILSAFAKFAKSLPESSNPPRLVLIGSVRSNSPDEKHIYRLRLEVRALKIDAYTTFLIDAPFETIMLYLRKASVGVNGMYSEHFGIGNVEGQAAGLILVCHNSGGPKLDICLPVDGKPTGLLAETEDEYADAFRKVHDMTKDEIVAMRLRARKSAHRFTDELFAEKWQVQLDKMVTFWRKRNRWK
ncbi:hypothetical protein R6Q59_010063 [Mikania micrantha]